MTEEPVTPKHVVRAIHRQIEKAMPPVAVNASGVITYISRTMFLVYLVGTGFQLSDAELVANRHIDGTFPQDIWGSELVILSREDLYSYSVRR